jgi:ornithine cyclodeaminase/alanine dehydrogenase-like protein (mu-crystallin family)
MAKTSRTQLSTMHKNPRADSNMLQIDPTTGCPVTIITANRMTLKMSKMGTAISLLI